MLTELLILQQSFFGNICDMTVCVKRNIFMNVASLKGPDWLITDGDLHIRTMQAEYPNFLT